MSYSAKLFACAGCGTFVWRKAPKSAEVRCIDCSIERSAENARQLSEKRGAFYDRWAAGIAAAGAAEVRRSQANKAAERAG